MPQPTAYCYDPFNLRHHLAGHPENRERLRGTWDLLQATASWQACWRCPAHRPPTSSCCVSTAGGIWRWWRWLPSAMLTWTRTPTSAAIRSRRRRLAAGGLCNVVGAVLQGEAANGFALVRPPGHHATPDRAMGFCLYNNVAIAARAAQAEHGLERVLIVDFDVHHGNGTQDAFYEDGSVLFFSTHQYPFYPGTGHWRETGSGRGAGTTVNVPMPAGVGDSGYFEAFDTVLAPIARRFQPQFILVSAGYDAHWNDPLAGMHLSIPGYAALIDRLLVLADELCGGRMVLTLEGGYQSGSAGSCRTQHHAPTQRQRRCDQRPPGTLSLG